MSDETLKKLKEAHERIHAVVQDQITIHGDAIAFSAVSLAVVCLAKTMRGDRAEALKAVGVAWDFLYEDAPEPTPDPKAN